MKYLLSLLITLMIVLPDSINAQSNTQAELDSRTKERLERQKELRARHQKNVQTIRENQQRKAAQIRQKTAENAQQIRERTQEIRRKNQALSMQKNRQIKACPDGAFLGVESSGISRDKAEKLGFSNPYGSYVTKVFKNTAAHKAGLQPFDYIVGIDKYEMSESEDLTDLLSLYETGDQATVHFIRDGKRQSAKLTFASREEIEWDENKKEKAFLGVSHLSNSSCDASGVKVNVVENSTAAAMGLEDGDIITSINGNPIIDWDDVTTALNNVSAGERVKVGFDRDGQEGSATANIKSYAESKSKNFQKEKSKTDYVKPEPKKQTENFGYAFFGVYTEEISKEKAKKLGCDNPYGSYVTGVIPGTAAERAGIGKMDYIFGFDEYRTGQYQDLTGILKKYAPGDRAVIHLVRKGKKMSSDVTFGSRENIKEEKKKTNKDKCEDTFFGITSAGLGNGNGVKVNVVKSSTAADMGIQNGDVILTIDGYIMTDWDDISMAIDRLSPGDKITVGYDHQGTTTRMCVPIKSYAETKNCKDCNCNEYNYTKDYDKNKNKYENEIALAKGYSGSGNSEGRIDLSEVDVRISEVSGELFTPKSGSTRSYNNLIVEDLELEANEDKGLFELQFELPSRGATVVRVYNDSGRVIYDYDLGQFTGEFEDDIDLAQNGTGNYFLQITQDSKSYSRKIELNKN